MSPLDEPGRPDGPVWLERIGVAGKMLLPGLVDLSLLLLAAPLAGLLKGWMGVAAAAVAAAVCALGAAIGTAAGMLVGLVLAGPGRAAYEFLAGMLLRMGVPLGAGAAIHLAGGPLAEAGILYYLLLFYPVTLAVETALSLPPNQR